MRVECPLCSKIYESILRKCPDCGQQNEACTSKFEKVTVEIEQSVLNPFQAECKEMKRNPQEMVQEALEEWLDRRQKGKR